MQQVFLAPMDRTDPSGRRIQEAFKRIQLVLRKPTVARTPWSKMMIGFQDLYNRPIIGKLLGRSVKVQHGGACDGLRAGIGPRADHDVKLGFMK